MDEATLRSYAAVIVPSGFVSDRLRYTENPEEPAPATRFLQRAFAEPNIIKGIICHDDEENVVYWYHAVDVKDGRERKIFASQFGDDFDAIPAYEQIYALAGPVQTYRITGDPAILKDAEMTINLFDKFFLDRERGGYFSHIDPVRFDPKAESLTFDRARKNWNSVGDHAPAYLINLYLATGDKRFADFLASTADTIENHFQDYDDSPFVQEKFHEDTRTGTKNGKEMPVSSYYVVGLRG